MNKRSFILITGLACVALNGCKPSQPMHLYTGLDASGGTRQRLGGYVVLSKSCFETLQPGQDRLTLYRVDNKTQEFSDGVYDGNTEGTLESVVAEVKQSAGQNGTYPAKFWSQVADRAEAESNATPTVVLLMSDGDNDDETPQAWASIQRSASRLAKCRQVRAVIVCGVEKSNMERLRTAFAPLKDRFHPITATELRDEKVLPLLEEARRPLTPIPPQISLTPPSPWIPSLRSAGEGDFSAVPHASSSHYARRERGL